MSATRYQAVQKEMQYMINNMMEKNDTLVLTASDGEKLHFPSEILAVNAAIHIREKAESLVN